MTVENIPDKNNNDRWFFLPDTDTELSVIERAKRELIPAYPEVLANARFFQDEQGGPLFGVFPDQYTAIVFEHKVQELAQLHDQGRAFHIKIQAAPSSDIADRRKKHVRAHKKL